MNMSSPDALEAVEHIYQALLKRWPETRIEPSLDRIAALCDALGSPERTYPVVHIAGTNGKTTTSRMIDSIFSELGYRTGRFTSPHLESFLERISLKGEPITPEGAIATYNDIALYLDLIDSRQPHPISFFEAMTALAAQPVEAAKVLTAKILEKSAIPYREGLEFLVSRRDIAVGGQLISVSGIHGEYTDLFIPLYGAHQASNAAVAIATVEAFAGVKLDEEIVRSAFAKVTSPGRCEVLYRDPTVIVDAAHNPHGAHALAATISSEFDFETVFGVLAILGEKDVHGVLLELEPVIDRLVVTQNSSDRALPVEDLYEAAIKVFGVDRVFKEVDLQRAITTSIEQCTLINQTSEGVSAVLITGSVVTAGESRAILRRLVDSRT